MDHGALRATSLKPVAKVAARIAGGLLSIAAIVFFIRLVIRQGVDLSRHPPLEMLAVVCTGATIYAIAVILLSLIWTALVQSDTRDSSIRKVLVASYLRSQFAKYLPGNILQYAIRHALGRQTGIAHGALAAAAILEAILLCCAAVAIVVCFGMPAVHSLFAGAPDVPAACAALVLLVVPLLAWMPEQLKPSWMPRYSWPTIAAALVGYVVFFILFGVLFFTVLLWCDAGTQPFLGIVSSSSLAWLVGFLIPGAPAGAGLRETALALGAGSRNASNEVLAAILLFRLMTLGGDFLAFLVGCWISFSSRSGTD